MYDLTEELRSHICTACLLPDDPEEVVDIVYEGTTYKCRDIETLLSIPCGCEFFVELD